MSPSLKYLMVSSIAARKASSEPMSLTATLGVEVASVLLVMCWWTPDADRNCLGLRRARSVRDISQGWRLDAPGQHHRRRSPFRTIPQAARPWRTAEEHSAAFSI